MTGPGASSALARIRPGLWAGAIVGLLTGFCYVFLFGRLDVSRGNPFRSLLTLGPATLAVWAFLVAAGAFTGALVSLRTSDE